MGGRWRRAFSVSAAKDGEVRALLETALDQEDGLRDTAKYRTILRAVAGGATERNEIANRSGLANDRGLTSSIPHGTRLLGKTRQRRRQAQRRRAYAVADPALRFHQRFVEPNRSVLSASRQPSCGTPRWNQNDQYMGLEFERIGKQAYDRHAARLGCPCGALGSVGRR